jgi:signal transduction histidine kinase
MTHYVRQHLGVKLFLSYLAVVAVGALILFVISQSILPSAFNRHMLGLGGGQMMGMGRQGIGGQGLVGQGGMAQLFADFRASFNDALTYAALAAIAVAVALSLFFSRSVLAPVRRMSAASQRIADGHYDERVDVQGGDELAQLASRFNQMAASLEQVESMRRRLIGDVSHELRTPLTAIKGSMEGLIDGVLPATVETYEQIHAEADRLNRLVDDLQELSRVEARAYDLQPRPLDVASLVRTVTKRLAPRFESQHISLNLELPADVPAVLADEDRLVQVLTNLVGNALQYTPEGGSIRIAARRSSQEVEISVGDTGIGIPPEHLAHIFDRFYRVDKSRSRRTGGGSGIGLTIARALVEAQGGRIWAESDGEGRGSTFFFTVPVAK